jgi:hypothetical protein
MAESRLNFNTGSIVDPYSASQVHINNAATIIGDLSKQYLEKQQYDEKMAESRRQYDDTQNRFAQEMALNREKFDTTNALAQSQEKRLEDEHQYQLDERAKAEKAKQYLANMAGGGYLDLYKDMSTNKRNEEANNFGNAGIAQVYKRADYAVDNAPNDEAKQDAIKARDLLTSTLVSNNAVQKQTQWALDNPNTPLLPGQQATLNSVSGLNREDVKGVFLKNAINAGVDVASAATAAQLGIDQVAGNTTKATPEQQLTAIKTAIEALNDIDNTNTGKPGATTVIIGDGSKGTPSNSTNNKDAQTPFDASNFYSGWFNSTDSNALGHVNKLREAMARDSTFAGLTSEQLSSLAGGLVTKYSVLDGNNKRRDPSRSVEDMLVEAKANIPKLISSVGGIADLKAAKLADLSERALKVVDNTNGRVPEINFGQALDTQDVASREKAEKSFTDYKKAQELQDAIASENSNTDSSNTDSSKTIPGITAPTTENLIASGNPYSNKAAEELAANIRAKGSTTPERLQNMLNRAKRDGDLNELVSTYAYDSGSGIGRLANVFGNDLAIGTGFIGQGLEMGGRTLYEMLVNGADSDQAVNKAVDNSRMSEWYNNALSNASKYRAADNYGNSASTEERLAALKTALSNGVVADDNPILDTASGIVSLIPVGGIAAKIAEPVLKPAVSIIGKGSGAILNALNKIRPAAQVGGGTTSAATGAGATGATSAGVGATGATATGATATGATATGATATGATSVGATGATGATATGATSVGAGAAQVGAQVNASQVGVGTFARLVTENMANGMTRIEAQNAAARAIINAARTS